MKKTILLALMAAVVILCSCKKEDKTNPNTPVTKDSYNIEFRYYVTIEQMDYIDVELYSTFSGESEAFMQLPAPQALDAQADFLFINAVNSYNKLTIDDFKVYVFNRTVKPGQQVIRYSLKIRDGVQLPEKISFCGNSYVVSCEGQIIDDLSTYGYNYKTSSLAERLETLSNLPITFTIPKTAE